MFYKITGTLIRSKNAGSRYFYFIRARDADIPGNQDKDEDLGTATVSIPGGKRKSNPFEIKFSEHRFRDGEFSSHPDVYFELHSSSSQPEADTSDRPITMAATGSGEIQVNKLITIRYSVSITEEAGDDEETGSQSAPEGFGQMADTDLAEAHPANSDESGGEAPPVGVAIEGETLRVKLVSNEPDVSESYLWDYIKSRSAGMSFPVYQSYLDDVLCVNPEADNGASDVLNPDCLDERVGGPRESIVQCGLHSTDAFSVLRGATEAFLLQQCGHSEGLYFEHGPLSELNDEQVRARANEFYGQVAQSADARILPYFGTIRQALGSVVIDDSKDVLQAGCTGILRSRISNPCFLELIWNYWHEQGLLVQTLGAISLRFQNRRLPGRADDPLAQLQVDPLRPLSNLMWGYVQSEADRLSVARRAYEYLYAYGLTIEGKAVPRLAPAETRAEFLGAFHGLLQLVSRFYAEDNDSTVRADAFPVLNALRDLHMVLAKGAHNQYGDLPWTARSEMLVQQYLLARPEMREFLGGRTMVPYAEGWMDRVETVKGLVGWPGPGVTHFRDLAVYGEQLLLSVRFGNWSVINDQDTARAWAIAWRSEIQRYVYAYRAVTGVDLSGDVVSARLGGDEVAQPAALMRRLHQNGAGRPPAVVAGDGAVTPVPRPPARS